MPSNEFVSFFFFNGSQIWVHLPILFTPWQQLFVYWINIQVLLAAWINIQVLLATARLANIATNGLVTILLPNVPTINYYHYHYCCSLSVLVWPLRATCGWAAGGCYSSALDVHPSWRLSYFLPSRENYRVSCIWIQIWNIYFHVVTSICSNWVFKTYALFFLCLFQLWQKKFRMKHPQRARLQRDVRTTFKPFNERVYSLSCVECSVTCHLWV